MLAKINAECASLIDYHKPQILGYNGKLWTPIALFIDEKKNTSDMQKMFDDKDWSIYFPEK